MVFLSGLKDSSGNCLFHNFSVDSILSAHSSGVLSSWSIILPTQQCLGEPSKHEMSQIVEKVHKGVGVEAKIKIVYISNVEYFDQRGGCLNFSHFSQSQLFCNITFIRNVYISIFSQFRSREGGSSKINFFPNSKQSKLSQGGFKKIMDFFHNLGHFFWACSPQDPDAFPTLIRQSVYLTAI